MRKIIGLLSALALAIGVFLAANTVSPENNSELSLLSLTALNTAEAYCSSGVGQRPIYGYESYQCGYDGESGEPEYCTRRTIVGYGDYTNNGSCEDGSNCWSGEGDVDYDCYSR